MLGMLMGHRCPPPVITTSAGAAASTQERRKEMRRKRRMDAAARLPPTEPMLPVYVPPPPPAPTSLDQQHIELEEATQEAQTTRTITSEGGGADRDVYVELSGGLDQPFENVGAACWHCLHPYEGVTVHIPSRYNAIRKIFRIYGSFCSPSCAKAYILADSRIMQSTMSMFRSMLCGVYGWPPAQLVNAAPPRQRLRLFDPVNGLTIEEFRQHSVAIDSSALLAPNRMVYDHRIYMEHHHRLERRAHDQTYQQSRMPRLPPPPAAATASTEPANSSRGIVAFMQRQPIPTRPPAAATRTSPSLSKRKSQQMRTITK